MMMKPIIDPTPIAVINLDRCPDTYKTFCTRNAHVGPVRRLAAVDGAAVDRLDLQRRGIIADELDYTDGALGCALSHVTLWREVASGSQALTVCEDDAVFAPDFVATSEDRLAELPDEWDIVLWTWLFDTMLVYQVIPGQPSFLVHMLPSPSVDDFAETWQAPTSPRLFRLNRAVGTTCYTISPKGAARLLTYCMPLRRLRLSAPEQSMTWPNTGIDLMMSVFYPAMNAYVSLPPLATTPNVNSTTRLTMSPDLLDRVAQLSIEVLVGEVAAMRPIPSIEVQIYKTWILANPQSEDLGAAWFNLGNALARADDYNNAMIAFQTVRVLNPDFSPASTALNLMLRRAANPYQVEAP